MTKEPFYKTILISPHADDIAFSLGGTLLQNFFNGPSIMITVFTKSNFSPCLKIFGPETITKTRHFEDLEFTKKLDLEFKSFNFSEPPLRGYSRLGIFANKDATSDPIYTEVYFALSKLIKSYGCELIVSPMGLGNHIDHIMLCDICNKIARENDIKIIFYEDLHYASLLTLKKIKARAEFINPNLKPLKINITQVFDNKIKNIKLYKTQVREISLTMIKSHAIRLGTENKTLKNLLSFNLFKYLLFLFTNNRFSGPSQLYERIWQM